MEATTNANLPVETSSPVDPPIVPEPVVDQPSLPTPVETPPAVARLPLQVVIAHLHDGTITKLPVETMSAALHLYRGRIAAARADRPFIAMSDLHWKVELTYKGGKVEVMTISNGEKVLARAAGVANLTRRQAAGASA